MEIEKITILCNQCGKPFDILDEQEDFSLRRHIGYGSKYDGELLELHLCCNCMDKLIDSCKISPTTDLEAKNYKQLELQYELQMNHKSTEDECQA